MSFALFLFALGRDSFAPICDACFLPDKLCLVAIFAPMYHPSAICAIAGQYDAALIAAFRLVRAGDTFCQVSASDGLTIRFPFRRSLKLRKQCMNPERLGAPFELFGKSEAVAVGHLSNRLNGAGSDVAMDEYFDNAFEAMLYALHLVCRLVFWIIPLISQNSFYCSCVHYFRENALFSVGSLLSDLVCWFGHRGGLCPRSLGLPI